MLPRAAELVKRITSPTIVGVRSRVCAARFWRSSSNLATRSVSAKWRTRRPLRARAHGQQALQLFGVAALGLDGRRQPLGLRHRRRCARGNGTWHATPPGAPQCAPTIAGRSRRRCRRISFCRARREQTHAAACDVRRRRVTSALRCLTNSRVLSVTNLLRDTPQRRRSAGIRPRSRRRANCDTVAAAARCRPNQREAARRALPTASRAQQRRQSSKLIVRSRREGERDQFFCKFCDVVISDVVLRAR